MSDIAFSAVCAQLESARIALSKINYIAAASAGGLGGLAPTCSYCESPFSTLELGEAHVVQCERNPMVAEIARLRADVANLVAERDSWRAQAVGLALEDRR